MSRNQLTKNLGTWYSMKCDSCKWQAVSKVGPSLVRQHTRRTRYTIKSLRG